MQIHILSPPRAFAISKTSTYDPIQFSFEFFGDS